MHATVHARHNGVVTIARRAFLAASFIAGQAFVFLALLAPVMSLPWLSGFRGYFAADQLSYAAIAVTASQGNLDLVEPFTETGVNYYPSAWYLLMGVISGVTGVPIHLTWVFLGLITIGAAIAFLGWIGFRLSGWVFAPVLPGAVLLTGVLATVTANYWYAPLGFHAVIWGPFGSLFTLNSEAVALPWIAAMLSLAMLAAAGRVSVRGTVIGIAIAIGVLANIHTYAFISAVIAFAAFAAVWCLSTAPSRSRLLATMLALGLVLVTGPFVAGIIGALPMIGLVLAPAVIAAWPLITTHWRLVALALVIAGGLAAPQFIRTTIGLLAGDDFLEYRQASTLDNLSVPVGSALIAALPLLLIVGFIVVVLAATRRSPASIAVQSMLIALGFSAVLMAANERWGFTQEPYRFWLQFLIINLLVVSVITAWAIHHWSEIARAPKLTASLVGVAAIGLWVFSLADFRAFTDFARAEGIIAVSDERAVAIAALVPEDNGLMLVSRCMDPKIIRLISGTPVADYNTGIAWPTGKNAIDYLQFVDPEDLVIPGDLSAAGVVYVLTDSACAEEWVLNDARIQPVAIEPYSDGLLTLSRVTSVD